MLTEDLNKPTNPTKPSTNDVAFVVLVGLISLITLPILLFVGAMLVTFGAIQYSGTSKYILVLVLVALGFLIYLLSRKWVLEKLSSNSKLISKIVLIVFMILLLLAFVPIILNYLKNG